MATIVLSAMGASLGGGLGGAVLGLSGAAIGRAVGATMGRAIDQRLLGGGSRAVETGRIDRLRLQTAGEGLPLPRIWGQMRIPGHVIWTSALQEVARTEDAGGGKGSSRAQVKQISYRLSVALGLCEGEILGVGRVWADGEEIAAAELNMRVYPGSCTQLPDPAIVAHEGEASPAYRGLAYVVLEDLLLERWGNRMPQLSFEVTRPAQDGTGLCRDVRAVALIPGTGEYSLATSQVTQDLGLGETRLVNVNTPMGGTDLTASLEVLGRELPNVGSVSVVVSWFGDDLRIGQCRLQPKIDQKENDGDDMPWRVAGIGRQDAQEVARVEARPIYGGTPADQSVIEALRAIAASGRKAVFYPFILMEQLAGNGLPDPYGADEQPVMPWRGRITSSIAAGRAGSSDLTQAAVTEVAAFFGVAEPEDFIRAGDHLSYRGPAEWSYRRFILHYAHLCATSGAVDAFIIGSEMVGMTRIRGPQNSYPAVAELRRLAADVRQILGDGVKIGYAADWSEYFGHHPGNGALYFHLDPLWSDENIDFIGIDNYMPLSDWRDGPDHLDAHWGRIDRDGYLRANICGGEGYDWFYASEADRDAQIRTPITDGTYGEAWVWRYKDLRSWWSMPHHDRPAGIRSATPTAWLPGSKPIWFTEFGCAALDKATNQPNKFLDARSSESMLPHYSDGRRDDALQEAYIAAIVGYWSLPENNPRLADGGRMVDLSRAHVWCWDARPYPAFPGCTDLWSDGPAWERGHWLNGRAGAVRLSAVVADICRAAGLCDFDVSDLSGLVRGYHVTGGETGRAALQPLMQAYGFDAVERDGQLQFRRRSGVATWDLGPEHLALAENITGLELVRAQDAQLSGAIRLTHVAGEEDYLAATADASLPNSQGAAVSDSEFALSLTRSEGRQIVERWLSEAAIAHDSARFALPPSLSEIGPGDVIRLRDQAGEGHCWRIDRVERAGAITVDALRVEEGVYRPALIDVPRRKSRSYVAAGPVLPVFLDLPLLRGSEAPHAPYLAIAAQPWSGPVAAYISVEEEGGFQPNLTLERGAVVGLTETELLAARPGLIDRGAILQLRIKGGALRSVSDRSLFAGANLLAIGDGSMDRWEVLQFGQARPVDTGLWEISYLLRGQAGSDGLMPETWPVGSQIVLLNGAPQQVDLSPNSRGQQRFWRIGPAARAPDDAIYRTRQTVAQGEGLRPYEPCHLRLRDKALSWVRRTRIDGDAWEAEVPLGEAQEIYRLRIIRNEVILHESELSEAKFDIPASLWADLSGGTFAVTVAQLSDRYGAGPSVRRDFYGQ